MTDITEIEVNLYIDVEKDSNLKQTAQIIEQRLSQFKMVKEAEAVSEKPRLTGVEVVAAIGVTVLVIRGSGEIVGELRKFIMQLKGLIGDIKGLKDVFVEVKDKRIPLAEVNEDDPEQLKALTHP